MTWRPAHAAAVLLAAASAITCSNLDNVSVPADGQTTIPGSVLGGLLGPVGFLGFSDIDVSEAQEFRNQGYSKDQIDSVRLEVFTLAITAPQGGNFDFLSEVSFFAESEGLPRVEIARINPVPRGASALELEILDVELRDYAVADSMTITTTATGVTPDEDTTISAHLVLDVDVDVSGALGCRIGSAQLTRSLARTAQAR